MIFVVTYRYDPDQSEAIAALRPRHREFLAELHAQGTLRASGPWVGGTAAGAYLLMNTTSAEHAGQLGVRDPFRAAGVITERTIQGWEPVIGSLD